MITNSDNKVREELGNKLKQAREKINLTQAEVAENTGMTINYYAMIERGEANLSYDKLRKLFKFLRMKSSEMPL